MERRTGQREGGPRRGPAAREDRRSGTLERGARRVESLDRRGSLIHDSPRMAAQRRRIDALRGGTAQREALEEEELQMRSADRPTGGARATPEPADGLPPPLRSGIERLSGVDVSDVRVRRGSDEPAGIDAHAFARGSEIHLAPGREGHLAHEAWHVVQQRQGRVRPTMEVGGVPVSDDPALEREADVMGGRAAAQGRKEAEDDAGRS